MPILRRLALLAPLAAVLATAVPADARHHYSHRYYDRRSNYEQCRAQRRHDANKGTAIGAGVGGIGTAIAGGGLGGALLGAGAGAIGGRVLGREASVRCSH